MQLFGKCSIARDEKYDVLNILSDCGILRYEMVDDQTTNDAVSWNPDGNG